MYIVKGFYFNKSKNEFVSYQIEAVSENHALNEIHFLRSNKGFGLYLVKTFPSGYKTFIKAIETDFFNRAVNILNEQNFVKILDLQDEIDELEKASGILKELKKLVA